MDIVQYINYVSGIICLW